MGQQNGVGPHRTACPPGEGQVGQGDIINRVTCRQSPVGRIVAVGLEEVGLHGQQATVDLTQLPTGQVRGRALQQPDVLLARQDLDRTILIAGSDDDLGEDLGNLLGHLHADRAIGGDDATESAQRVTGVSLAMGFGNVGAGSDAARIRVLDDGHAGGLEVEGRPPRRVGVDIVVVAHGLAMELAGSGQAGLAGATVYGCGLVGVLAIAQRVGQLPGRTDEGGNAVNGHPITTAEPGGHRDVIGSGVGEGTGRQHATLLHGVPAFGQGPGKVFVLVRVGQDRHIGVILSSGTHHRRATDVDLLNALIEISPLRYGLGEGVQIAHDEVKGLHF